MKKKFYITTAIDYANSTPHIGHAYEKVGADVLARFMRMSGYDVRFQMGNDEHSANVFRAAQAQKLDPQTYCDRMRMKFEAAWKNLEISYDDFIQTSEARHEKTVSKIFQKIFDAGDIYKGKYEGWYCESCEAFYTEKDLIGGTCPNHKTKAQWLEEDNYFFKLSKYEQALLDHYQKHPEFIIPASRRSEIVNVVKGGLQDISISRSSVEWGIHLPKDPTHVVYVWFDALINYISALTYGGKDLKNFKKWWPADLHVIGKDIIRFHCIIWPAMLMSAEIPLPKMILTHGFIYLKGEKMSKSLGNIVDPLDVVKNYGADALRYYLLRESSFGSDGDFTWEGFIHRYNSDLANDIGNLLNRTLGMIEKYFTGTIPKPSGVSGKNQSDTDLEKQFEISRQKISESLLGKNGRLEKDVDFHEALAGLWQLIAATDKYIDVNAPWKLAKKQEAGDAERLQTVLYYALHSLRRIAFLLKPFLPSTATRIYEQLGLDIKVDEKQTFQKLTWGPIHKNWKGSVKIGKPLFPRIETEKERSKKLDAPKGVLMVDQISIDDFMKLDLRVATIQEAERVEGADKLLKLKIDLGGEIRQIVAGIALVYSPESLIGKQIGVVSNLKPAKIRGVESNGMLLAASDQSGRMVLMTPDAPIAPGSKIK